MAYQDVILASAPYAYWRGTITTGQVLDSSGNTRFMNVNGSVLTNAASIVPGTAEPCLVFPGLDTDFLDAIAATTMAQTNSLPGTIEFWILDDPADDNVLGYVVCLGGSGADMVFGSGPVNGIMPNTNNSANTPPISVRYGELKHVVVRSNPADAAASRKRTYINGFLASFSTLGAYTLSPSTRRTVGIKLVGTSPGSIVPGTALKARVQEIAIYDSALSEDDIYRHYCAGMDTGSMAPRVVSAVFVGLNKLLVTFSKPMFNTATTGNFSIPGATVDLATPSTFRDSVTLTLSAFTDGASLTLTTSGLIDALGVAPTPATASFTVLATGDGRSQDPQTWQASTVPMVSTGSAAEVRFGQAFGGYVYAMRGVRVDNGEFVYWSSLDAPDLTGAQSSYAPGDLTSIVRIAVTPPDGQT